MHYHLQAKILTPVQALRVLSLLEAQHRKLAHIIRTQDLADVTSTAKPSTGKDAVGATADSDRSASSKSRPTTSAMAAARIGSEVRDSSPSLARDIASRRGIPPSGSTKPSAAALARSRQLSPESRRRASPLVGARIPPSIVESQSTLQRQARKARKAEDDEGFTKFYSNLTTGTMSKLSSVLAYAGLPLTADDIKPEQAHRSTKLRRANATTEPDVKKIFSPASLNAIEEEHRQRGTLGHGFGPAESFYVVPPSGGTQTYRNIVKGSRSILGEDDEDSFVDAREAMGPPSPKHSRNMSTKRSNSNPQTDEEMQLENVTLKHTVDELARRLANFEAHAQDASMAALTQSVVALRRPMSADTASADGAMAERVRQLERQVERDADERQKLETHAMAQEKALKKWFVSLLTLGFSGHQLITRLILGTQDTRSYARVL